LHGFNFSKILQHYYSDVAIGTIPLNIDERHGARLTFYVPHNARTPKLNVSYQKGNQPLNIVLNGKPLAIKPTLMGNSGQINLQAYVKHGQVNQLTVKPADRSQARAWVELVSGKNSS
jgi:hypothetical protein